MKKFSIILTLLVLTSCDNDLLSKENTSKLEEVPHALVAAARQQIGVVTQYDTGYYHGAYPPSDRGACTDLVEQALRLSGYDLKSKIDADMQANPTRYVHKSDPNINFRRVVNVKTFLDHHAQKLSTCVDLECFEEGIWQPGDIVTYDQIPGSLWHIAVLSDQKNEDGIPLLIHNYGKGVVEDDYLLEWPAPITGHFRIEL